MDDPPTKGYYEPEAFFYFAHQLSPKFNSLVIYGISDIHYGSPQCSIKHFDRMIEALKPANAYAILNGDMIQADIRMSKGDIFRQVGTPQDQRDWIIDRLTPVKDKILGCTMGNHELRIYNQTGDDHCKDIAKALKCPYWPNGILLKISFGSGAEFHPEKPYVYYVYATHGSGGAQTSGAKVMKLKRTATHVHASVYFQSHDHTENVEPESYLIPDNRTKVDKETGFTIGTIREHQKMLIKTGSAQMWGGFAQRSGHAPSQLGTPAVILSGRGKPWVNVII